jgi:hypothetical protein
MRAGIPPIHIWEDGYVIWIGHASNNMSHVYETFFSDAEMIKVRETIEVSHFWEYKEPGFPVPDYSWLTIWVNQLGQEKRVVVRDSKFEVTVSSLFEIFEASPLKAEYFPKQGYLFASKAESYLTESGFSWPDEKVGFDFSKSEQDSSPRLRVSLLRFCAAP